MGETSHLRSKNQVILAHLQLINFPEMYLSILESRMKFLKDCK